MSEQGCAVLVADCDPASREGMVAALCGAGFATVAVAGAAEAAEQLERARPRLVVTDIDMPGFGTLDLARAARALDPLLPILFVTEWTDDVTDRNTPPPCYCLSKPFTADILVEVAARLLAGRPPDAPPG